MAQAFFAVDTKVPTFLDKIGHRVETRRNGEEVKVLDLDCRIFPFTGELSSDLPDASQIKRSLFKLSTGDPLTHCKAVAFRFAPPRQVVTVFASTDTEKASIAFDQVAVRNLRAKLDKTTNTWALHYTLSFGGIGKAEAEYVIGWHTTQRALGFAEAEPSLDFEEEGAAGSDADQKARQPAAPTLKGLDGGKADPPAEAADKPSPKKKPATERANRRLHSHQSKKKGAKKR